MVAPNDTSGPRERVGRLMAKIQAERDRILPNPDNKVRLAENKYLLLRLSTRTEFVEANQDLSDARMEYSGALRQQLERQQTTSSRVADSVVMEIFGIIEMAIANDRETAPRNRAARRPNDLGPGASFH